MSGDNRDNDDWSWGVLVPGLRREEANDLAAFARERGFGWHGQAETVDPSTTLVLSMDRATAEEILREALAADPGDPRYEALLDDIKDWLERSVGNG